MPFPNTVSVDQRALMIEGSVDTNGVKRVVARYLIVV
jgi:hypothetical protein